MCTPIFSILLTVREVPNSAVLTTSSLKSLLVQIRKTKESKSTKSTPDYIYKEHKLLIYFITAPKILLKLHEYKCQVEWCNFIKSVKNEFFKFSPGDSSKTELF